jgi:hypothetical protein
MKKQPSNNVAPQIKIEVDSILEKYDCVICMCKLSKPTVTKCGHSFCFECISEIVNQKHECPLCNHNLTKEDLVVNYTLDSLLRSIEAKKEEETKAYFDNMVDHAHVELGQEPAGSMTRNIETIFKLNLK